jgi:hypothetical protein
MPCAGVFRAGQSGTGTSIRDNLRAPEFKSTSICSPSCATSNVNHWRQGWSRRLNCGGGTSLWSRVYGDLALKAIQSPRPVVRPANWTARVNTPLTAKELDRVRLSIERGQPYAEDEWMKQTVQKLGFVHTVRPEGRPPKAGRPTTDTEAG